MWYHLYSYGMNNEKELSKILAGTLQKCNSDLSTYLAKMYYCTTCGYKITLLLLSRMMNVDIVLIRPDFVWLSRPVAPITCGIVLVQDASGNFLGAKTKNPVYIGLVPNISLPDPNVIRSKLHEIRHQSTPNRPIRSQNEAFRQFGAGILPIVEMGSRKSQAHKGDVARQKLLGEDSSSSTSASTSLLRRHISKFEQQNFSQIAENSDETNDLSTTIDPNEAFVEDGQRNDIESSCDQENTPTSNTKDDSGQMSGTFDVGGTDSSTLVNNQSKHEQDMTITTGEEDKTETADPSAENYDCGDEDDNENDDNDENSCDGEEEEGIEDSTKQIEACDEDFENEEKDEERLEDEDDKLITDGSNKKHEENKADVNTANNDNSNNSDDIIPSENTQPEDNNSSITAPTMEKSQSETTQNNGDTKMGQSSTIQSVDIGQTQKSKEGKKPAMKRRLGMGGPAFTKRTLQVSMQDISIDSDKSQKTQDKNKVEGGKKSVMRKLMCTKCPEMFFMQEGYQRHLFKDHKVRCFDKHPPQVIEKIVTRCSQETYETNYRVVKTKNSDKGAEAVTNTDTTLQHIDMLEQENENETLEDDVNVKMKSGVQSKINENDENIENIFVSSKGPSKKNRKGKKRRGKKSHLTSRKNKTVSDQGDKEESESFKRLRKAMQNMYAINKEEPMVKCIGCDIYFYSEDGMRIDFQHVHTNLKGIGVSVINDFETDATLNDASTCTNAPDTAESELPEIVPPTQTVTRGQKRNRNECDTTVCNKKHSRGSPSPSMRLERKDNKKTVAEKKLVTKINSELKLRSKKSEVSDYSTPTSIHFTRSQRTGMQRNDDEVPHETVKQKKKRSNSNDFGTKPIPEKKKKKQVDAIEIVETHTKKSVEKN